MSSIYDRDHRAVRRKPASLCLYGLALFLAPLCVRDLLADQSAEIATVVVTAERVSDLDAANLSTGILSSADPAAFLDSNPALSVYSSGGVSSIPVMHGLNDDRIGVNVNGRQITSACANHMNPPLSYADPSALDSVRVESSPYSVTNGGDNIAGSIVVKSHQPKFTQPGQEMLKQARISSIYRSNNDGITEALSALSANESYSVGYAGSLSRAHSYSDGNGDLVRATQYEVRNHELTFGAQGASQLFTVKGGLQQIPFQGYVNQYMDMVDNVGHSLSVSDQGSYAWGKLDADFFWQHTDHEMGFFSDEKSGMMPMNVDGRDIGYALKAEIPTAERHLFRIGTDFHRSRLDDRWPPVPGTMMSPLEFVNINNGHKQVVGAFAEWEFKLLPSWRTIAGIRDNLVHSDSGEVQPYAWNEMDSMSEMDMGMGKMMMMENPDAAAAEAFNAADRSRSDNNLDLVLRSISDLSATTSLQAGFSRKTRSPNLYERYAWGRGTMAMTMIGWFGDANGYVGNLNLDPETANTVSATLSWHDAEQSDWHVDLTPYYTYVEDYIDVDQIGTFNPRMAMDDTKYLLQFANHDARIYGTDLSASKRLLSDSSVGDLTLKGQAGWLRGRRADSDTSLYHLMPLNGRLGLEQSKNGWTNAVELNLVDKKYAVDTRRGELKTPGYALVDIRTSYQWKQVRFDFGITNLLDRLYELPLGGVNYADWAADGMMGSMPSVPGAGRSFNLGITVDL